LEPVYETGLPALGLSDIFAYLPKKLKIPDFLVDKEKEVDIIVMLRSI